MKLFNLGDWYSSTFSASECDLISAKCEIANSDFYNGSASRYLADCISWLNTKDNYSICLRFVNKSIELLSDVSDKSELHFIYMQYILFFYKNRDIENNLELAEKYCNAQIELAPYVASELNSPFPVAHTGYEQMAVILKKRKDWAGVVELCQSAKNGGWAGDWDKRIDEAKKTFAKSKINSFDFHCASVAESLGGFYHRNGYSAQSEILPVSVRKRRIFSGIDLI